MPLMICALLVATENPTDKHDQEPFRLQIVDLKGKPLRGVNIVAKQGLEVPQLVPTKSVPIYEAQPIPASAEPSARSDAVGNVAFDWQDPKARYTLYVDGGIHGRAIVGLASPGDRLTIELEPKPRLRLSIRNVPRAYRDHFYITEVVDQGASITAIEHGPFASTSADTELTIPDPLGSVLYVGPRPGRVDSVGRLIDGPEGGAGSIPPRRVIVNARGTAHLGIVDFSSPFKDLYVEPKLAGPFRDICIRFENRDGSIASPHVLDVNGHRMCAATVTKLDSRRPQRVLCPESSTGWILRVPAFEGYLINASTSVPKDWIALGQEVHLVHPAPHDTDVAIRVAPCVEYHWQEFEFLPPRAPVGIHYASESSVLPQCHLPEDFSWAPEELIAPLRVPAGENTLLVIRDTNNFHVRLLDGSGGAITVDREAAKRTSISSLSPSGMAMPSRVLGLVAPQKGITVPVPIDDSSLRGKPLGNVRRRVVNSPLTRASLRGLMAGPTEARFYLDTNVNVSAVVDRDSNGWSPHVVSITPGLHHKPESPDGRTFTVKLMGRCGFARTTPVLGMLFWSDRSGVTFSTSAIGCDLQFVGVPKTGHATLAVLYPDASACETSFDLPRVNSLTVRLDEVDGAEPVLSAEPGLVPVPAVAPQGRRLPLFINGNGGAGGVVLLAGNQRPRIINLKNATSARHLGWTLPIRHPFGGRLPAKPLPLANQ